jgi:membrane protein implicated in regulation of membrane protease activity
VLLILGLLVAAFLAAGQAITFAWLSSFPERSSQLQSLEIKFWSYAVISAILLLIDLVLIARVAKQIRDRRNHFKAQ